MLLSLLVMVIVVAMIVVVAQEQVVVEKVVVWPLLSGLLMFVCAVPRCHHRRLHGFWGALEPLTYYVPHVSNRYMQWRFSSGKDKEMLEKESRKFTEEDRAMVSIALVLLSALVLLYSRADYYFTRMPACIMLCTLPALCVTYRRAATDLAVAAAVVVAVAVAAAAAVVAVADVVVAAAAAAANYYAFIVAVLCSGRKMETPVVGGDGTTRFVECLLGRHKLKKNYEYVPTLSRWR